MIQLQYREYKDSWVDIISITPINKVNTFYEGLNLVIKNETYIVLCFMNDHGNLETVENTEYNFRDEIRIKPVN